MGRAKIPAKFSDFFACGEAPGTSIGYYFTGCFAVCGVRGGKGGGKGDAALFLPFAGLQPGTKGFTDQWLRLAKERPDEMRAYEHLFIEETHYRPLVERLTADLGPKVDDRSLALRDVIWSTAVQHGPETSVVHDALAVPRKANGLADLTDKAIIEQIYAERARVDASGALVHFKSSASEIQSSIKKRFRQELTEALKMLSAELNQ